MIGARAAQFACMPAGTAMIVLNQNNENMPRHDPSLSRLSIASFFTTSQIELVLTDATS